MSMVRLRKEVREAVREALAALGPIKVDLAELESMKITDAQGNVINPATEDTLSLIKLKLDTFQVTEGKLEVLAHGIDDTGVLRPLLVDSSGALKAVIQNAELLVALSATEDSVEVYGRDYANNIVRSIAVDDSGRIRSVVENTVSISGSVSVTSEPAYDSVADLKKVSIERDNVGLATEATLSAVRSAVESIDGKVATESTLSQVAGSLVDSVESKTVADLTREVRDAVQGVQARYARLQIYDSTTSAWKDVVDSLPVSGSVSVTNFPTDYPDSGAHSRLDTLHSDLYDSTEAKTITTILKEVRDKSEWGYLPNLDITLSSHRDSIVSAIQGVQPRYARLQIYDSATSSWKDVVDRLPVSVDADNVGLAKEDTLQSILNQLDVALSTRASESTLSTVADRLYDTTEAKSITAILKETRDKVATETTLSTIMGYLYDSEEGKTQAELQKETRDHARSIDAFHYDFAMRRCGGRLLAVVDWRVNPDKFSINEWDVGLIRIEGATSYSIVKIADEGIPEPEGDASPYVLKIVVPAGGTVYVRVPVKASAFSVFAAYTTVYPKDYEVEVSLFITLGGNINSTRNKPPKRWRVYANTWGRFVTHWFMELHHGCAEVDLELYNPQSVDVTVYVGIFVAGEIKESVKCFGLLAGNEGGYAYIPLSNETFDWTVDIMLPMSFADCAHFQAWVGIESLDGTTVTADIYLNGIKIASGSTTSSTTVWAAFKYFFARSGIYSHPTLSLRFVISTTGSAKINNITIVFFGFSNEFHYQKYVETSVGGGATVTILDFSSDTKHIAGGLLEVSAPNDGDVYIKANTPEGEIDIYKIPANTTERIEIKGRYLYLKAYNTGTSSATVRGMILISDSFLPR